jgi:hypothetical protein
MCESDQQVEVQFLMKLGAGQIQDTLVSVQFKVCRRPVCSGTHTYRPNLYNNFACFVKPVRAEHKLQMCGNKPWAQLG